MSVPRNMFWRGYWAVTLAALCVGVFLAVRAPAEAGGGGMQRLVYLHLPVAINALIGALIVCGSGVAYLHSHRPGWDDLARGAAIVTVLDSTVLLLTGMIWAKAAWGHWWVWSPRLSFSLAFWCIYVIYLVIRAGIQSSARRAVISSIFGIVAFLDVPLLYLSAKLLPDVHPTVVTVTAGMYPALFVCLAGITLLSAGCIAAFYRFGTVARLRGDALHGLIGPT
ncbi:MAG: cytochrome c biogenesis protein CcsA [Phycisphaerae bacterium]|nr:cytochrome c biogenesis protein CcsA [Phycisphaerae bacterium]